MKFLSFLLLFLSACSETSLSQFKVVNPRQIESVWVKHVGLPVFNPNVHSDGCSGGMSAIYGKLTFLHKKHGNTLNWRQCCIVHDEAYYYGGTQREKKQADANLNNCVTQVVGKRYLGKAMQIAVEIGGDPNLPTPYRWGYGEDFKEPD